MRNLLNSILDDIESAKKAKKIEPHDATFREVQKEIDERLKKELNAMFKDGFISVGPTLNDKYIRRQ